MKRLLRIGLPLLALTAFTGCGPVDPTELSDSSKTPDSSEISNPPGSDIRGQLNNGCTAPTNAPIFCTGSLTEIQVQGGCGSSHWAYYCEDNTMWSGGCALWRCNISAPAEVPTSCTSYLGQVTGCH